MIALLRRNGRVSVSKIARRLNVARTTAQMWLQKPENSGVIASYSVNLSEEYRANRVRALVMIKFPPKQHATVEQTLGDMPTVISLYSISGAFDLAAVVSAGSMTKLDRAIDKIGCLEGIGETMSPIILSTKIDR